jgi:hypothetical protein
MKIIIRQYVVRAGRGVINVEVAEQFVLSRGERTVVAEKAWQQLMGLNSLDEDIDKRSPTRAMLRAEIGSRYAHQRHEVYDTFKECISITWVGVKHVSI